MKQIIRLLIIICGLTHTQISQALILYIKNKSGYRVNITIPLASSMQDDLFWFLDPNRTIEEQFPVTLTLGFITLQINDESRTFFLNNNETYNFFIEQFLRGVHIHLNRTRVGTIYFM